MTCECDLHVTSDVLTKFWDRVGQEHAREAKRVPVYAEENHWVKDPEWNFAHLVTTEGKFLCRPARVAPLPPRASDTDQRCPTCANIVGPSAL